VRKDIPRENHRHHGRPAAACQADEGPRAWRCLFITPAVDRLSRDTTDLLVIAREMQRAGAGIRSLAEPYLDTTSDFAEIVFAILGVAAKLERRRILERTARPGRRQGKGCQIRPHADPHRAPTERGPQAPRSGRDAAQRRAQLQCQSGDDFTTNDINNGQREQVLC
jgi:hypothetical protein